MIVQSRMIRGQLYLTLRYLGGKSYEVLRTPKDPNGQPTGQAAVIGQMYGMIYIDPGIRQRVHIALPGIISGGNDIPTLAGLLQCGDAPQSGDTLRRGSKTTKILSAVTSGPLFTLTCEELI